MSAGWEVQKSHYDAMVADTTLSAMVTSITDEPVTDQEYPYIVIGQMTEVADNRHRRLGYIVTHTIHIYTKPAGLGFYPAKKILERLNTVLNMKRFSMDTLHMLVTVYEQAFTERDIDKRIISARYRTWCDSDTDTIY
jgi:hypothetical protein